MKSYDIILPLGTYCAASYHLRHNNLQVESYPLDWVIIGNVKIGAEIIANDFKDFFVKERLVRKDGESGNHIPYVQKPENYSFFHCIDKDLTDLLDRLRKVFPDKDISLLRVNLSPDFGDKVEYNEVSPDILVYNVNYDMDKNIYTDRDTEMAQIMADFRMRPSKKAVEYKLNEVGFAIKRFLVNCLCCLVPVKRIRHKIRKKFNISTKFFNKN